MSYHEGVIVIVMDKVYKGYKAYKVYVGDDIRDINPALTPYHGAG